MRTLPGATLKIVHYATDAHLFYRPPIGWILHVADSNGGLFPYFNGLPAGDRKFSTGWSGKAGEREQYGYLERIPWAQAGGNGQYLAFETEGHPGEPLTPQQIQTLAEWHVALGFPDLLAEKPGDPGIGTHYMGGAAWGGHTCPDPSPGVGPRSHQRADILKLAKQLRGNPGEIMPTPNEIVTALADWDVSALCGEPEGTVNFQTALGRIYKNSKKAASGAAQPAPGSTPTGKPSGS